MKKTEAEKFNIQMRWDLRYMFRSAISLSFDRFYKEVMYGTNR